jgi:hypothetical protein
VAVVGEFCIIAGTGWEGHVWHVPAGAATFALDAVNRGAWWGWAWSAAARGVLVPAVSPRRVPVVGVVIIGAVVAYAEVAVDAGEGLDEAARWRWALGVQLSGVEGLELEVGETLLECRSLDVDEADGVRRWRRRWRWNT